MEFYSADAVLVVRPDVIAKGKAQIRKALAAIAEFFNHNLTVKQGNMCILEAGDTAMVLSRTLLDIGPKTDAANHSIERKATYVFKRDSDNRWRCIIDNSYGAELLDAAEQEI